MKTIITKISVDWLNNRLYTSKQRISKSEKKNNWRDDLSSSERWKISKMGQNIAQIDRNTYVWIYMRSWNFSLRERMKQRKYLVILWLRTFQKWQKIPISFNKSNKFQAKKFKKFTPRCIIVKLKNNKIIQRIICLLKTQWYKMECITACLELPSKS